MTEGTDRALSSGVARRMAFIDFRLLWEGRINRGDIQRRFGVSTPQASADLRRYQELAPENVAYDLGEKAYLATSAFRPRFVAADPERYLNELARLDAGLIDAGSTDIGFQPPFAALFLPRRRIDPEVLAALLRALRLEVAVRARYQSTTGKGPRWRWITPLALASDGMRWHVRGYCHEREAFLDFVLGRFLDMGETGNPAASLAEDADWWRWVTIRFGPNPALEEGHRRAIELDFGMADGEGAAEIRGALAFYLLQRLGLDRASECKPARARPLVLLNPEEIEAYRG